MFTSLLAALIFLFTLKYKKNNKQTLHVMVNDTTAVFLTSQFIIHCEGSRPRSFVLAYVHNLNNVIQKSAMQTLLFYYINTQNNGAISSCLMSSWIYFMITWFVLSLSNVFI